MSEPADRDRIAAAMRHAMELVSIQRLHGSGTPVSDRTMTLALFDARRVPPIVMLWAQASLTAAIARLQEDAVDALLADPGRLATALVAARAGRPQHAPDVGLGAASVLALAGRDLATRQ